MNYLLTNLASFITEKIRYSNIVDNVADQKMLPENLLKLKEEVEHIKCKFKLRVSSFSSMHSSNLYIDRHSSNLIFLIETVLFYLYEIDAGKDSLSRRILRSFYNEVCQEIEELLVFIEQFGQLKVPEINR